MFGLDEFNADMLKLVVGLAVTSILLGVALFIRWL